MSVTSAPSTTITVACSRSVVNPPSPPYQPIWRPPGSCQIQTSMVNVPFLWKKPNVPSEETCAKLPYSPD